MQDFFNNTCLCILLSIFLAASSFRTRTSPKSKTVAFSAAYVVHDSTDRECSKYNSLVTGNFQSASKFTRSISKKAIFQSKQPRARNLFAVVGDDTFEGDKSSLSEIRADKAKRDLDRIIKASTIAPKLTQTLHEVVQVSRISLLEVRTHRALYNVCLF